MTKSLNELQNFPMWINSLSASQQQEWYLRIKHSLPVLKQIGDTTELEKAIAEYERQKGINM